MGQQTGGKRVGDYELMQRIGAGGQASVYKGRCVSDANPNVQKDAIVAIKILRQFESDSRSERRFKRQMDGFLSLQHPNIIHYFESFTAQDELGEELRCLVMEYLEGEELKDVIGKHPGGVPWEKLQPICEQAIDALAYASEKGIIHRDIKPSNIFILSDGSAKIIDFGIARRQDATVTNTAGFKGTFDYMAPDFLKQGDEFRGDEVSDIFSLGVCFYEALTGRLPYASSQDTGSMGYVSRWQSEDFQEPSVSVKAFRVLNDAASTLARKSMHPDRDKRYGSYGEMIESFHKIQRRALTVGKDTYVFLEYLGKGGFGEVFKGRRAADGRVFAVKHLFPGHDPSRFVREARLLQQYSHPYIVGYEGFAKVERLEGDEYYLLMEYLEGMPHWSLRTRIKKEGSLDVPEVIHLFTCYLDALKFLHTSQEKPIIHRDLSPANLYAPPYDPGQPDERRPKLFDMGIARSEKTQTGGRVPGNPEYMAPEFVLDPDFRGAPASDVHNLGLCFYEALTGRRAFGRLPRETAEMWMAIRLRAEGKVEVNFEYPVFSEYPDLAAVVKRAIARNPKKRYQSAQEMREDLEDVGGLDEETRADIGEPPEVTMTEAVPSVSASVPVAVEGAPAPVARRAKRARKPLSPGARKTILVGGVAAAAALVLAVGLFAGLRSLGQRVPEGPGSFEPTSAHVSAVRKALDRFRELGVKSPNNAELGRRLSELEAAWEGLPARFGDAFDAAVDQGDVSTAESLLEQWQMAGPALDPGVHGEMQASMARRLEVLSALSALEPPSVSSEHFERVRAALRLIDRNITASTGEPEVHAWWLAKYDVVAASVGKLPAAMREALDGAIAESDLAAVEALSSGWQELDDMSDVAALLPTNASAEVHGAITNGVRGLLEERGNAAVASLGEGSTQTAESLYAWLREAERVAPSVLAGTRAVADAVVSRVRAAEAQMVLSKVAAVADVTAPEDVQAAQEALDEIGLLFRRSRPFWNSQDAAAVEEAARERCVAIATALASDAEKSDVLGAFVKVVPPAFRTARLAGILADVEASRLADERARAEINDALTKLETLIEALDGPAPGAWGKGLQLWSELGLAGNVRAQRNVAAKWDVAVQVFETSVLDFVQQSDALAALEPVDAALEQGRRAGLPGQETLERLGEALAARRQALVNMQILEGLDRLIRTLNKPAPDSWAEGLEVWSGLGLTDEMRENQAVAAKWNDAAHRFEKSVGDYLRKSRTVAALKPADAAIALGREKGLPGKGILDRLAAAAAERRTDLQELALIEQMDGVVATLGKPDPRAWLEGIEAWAGLDLTGAQRAQRAVAAKMQQAEAALDGAVAAYLAGADTMAALTRVETVVAAATEKGVPGEAAVGRLSAALKARRTAVAALEVVAKLKVIAGDLGKPGPDSWAGGLADWRGMAVSAEVRQSPAVAAGWDAAAKAFGASVSNYLQKCKALDGLKPVSTALDASAGSGVPGKAMHARLSAAVSARRKLIENWAALQREIRKETDRLTGLLGTIKAGDPASWRNALAVLGPLPETASYREDEGVRKLWQQAGGQVQDHVASYLGLVDPFEQRGDRLKEVEQLLAEGKGAAVLDGEALRAELGKQLAVYLARVSNTTPASVTLRRDGRDLGTLDAGARSELSLPSDAGEIEVQLDWGAAYETGLLKLRPVRGGSGVATLPAPIPKPRGIVAAGLPQDPPVVVSFRNLADNTKGVVDAQTTLRPGDYKFTFARSDYLPAESTVAIEVGVGAFEVQAPQKWSEAEALANLGQFEDALENEDRATADQVYALLGRQELAWEGHRTRLAAAARQWRDLKMQGMTKEWETSLEHWQARDYKAAGEGFTRLDDFLGKLGMKPQQQVCHFNAKLCELMAGKSVGLRAATALKTAARGVSVPAGTKREFDSLIKGLDSFVALARRGSAMARTEGRVLQQRIPKMGPLPLPE